MIGVILSSKIIESTLSAQFGDILPVELPIHNRHLISYQIDSIKSVCNDGLYLTIPKDYEFTTNHNINKIELEKDLTLIEVFKKVVLCFDKKEKIFIYYGDSLFLDIEALNPKNEYFFIQKPVHKYVWGNIFSNELVPAGGIIINVNKLLNLLIDCSNFEELTEKIRINDTIIKFSNFTWLDFGHTLTYFNSRKLFLESRSFNKLNFRDGFIVKSSGDILKMWAEYNWLLYFKNKIPNNIPYVTDFNINKNGAHYSIEYINHPPLSDIFVFGKLSDQVFIKILESLKRIIIKIRTINTCKDNFDSYNFLHRKLVDRKSEILKIAQDLNADVENIKYLIDDNLNYFVNKKYNMVPMHGDICFSNIIYDFSTHEPILIDPRGFVSTEKGFSIYGPESYDLYKLAHSYVIGYDFLIAGVSNPQFFSNNEMSKRLDVFINIFQIDKHDLKMGLLNLFLTMLPLHNDSKTRQNSFLGILTKISEL